MLYWIFDLDNTLYQLRNNISFNYNLLTTDDQLNYLLMMLPSKKVIFTNGTYNHALKCLSNLNITEYFSKIISRDKINSLKPNYFSYIRCMKSLNIKQNDLCVFFDDLPENLIEAKNLGWITVLISKEKYIHNNIDFWFQNIYLALNFFTTKINKNSTII